MWAPFFPSRMWVPSRRVGDILHDKEALQVQFCIVSFQLHYILSYLSMSVTCIMSYTLLYANLEYGPVSTRIVSTMLQMKFSHFMSHYSCVVMLYHSSRWLAAIISIGIQVNLYSRKLQKRFHSCTGAREQKFAGEFSTRKSTKRTLKNQL